MPSLANPTTQLTPSQAEQMLKVRNNLTDIISKEVTNGDRSSQRWQYAAMFLSEAMRA